MSWLIPLLGVLVSSLTALSFWRVQVLGRRKMEVAEETLVAMQIAIDAIDGARSPLVLAGEMHDAIAFFGGDPKKMPDPSATYLAFRHRLIQRAEDFRPIQKVRVLARYFLGEPVETALIDLLRIRNELSAHAETAAEVALSLFTSEKSSRDPFLITANSMLFGHGLERDVLSERMHARRLEIEKACEVHFRRRAVIWPFL
jgi:hypothetical protein